MLVIRKETGLFKPKRKEKKVGVQILMTTTEKILRYWQKKPKRVNQSKKNSRMEYKRKEIKKIDIEK